MNWKRYWVGLIRHYAKVYGVDPRAALAVARTEGLGGGVGDSGTSFGPFQLHKGGALPRGRDRAWAESQAGIDYAMRQIGQVAHGLHGQQAINAIVTRFERPANPQAEIAKATAYYGGIGGGEGATPVSYAQPRALPKTLSASGYLPMPGGGGGVQALPKTLGRSGYLPSDLPSRGPAMAPPGVPVSTGPTRLEGKLIGYPYQGTHTLGNWESDNAIDISMPIGTPLYAPADGVIGSQFGSLGKSGRFAGLRLHLLMRGNELYFAHLSRFAPGLRPGARVRAGQLIGYSGQASGVPHLHFGVRKGDPRRFT